MSKSRHDRVIKALYNICMSYKPYEKAKANAAHIEVSYKPIEIEGLARKGETTKYRYDYYPDLWFELRKPREDNRKIDVFEVWDTEPETERIQDIILASLVKGIWSFSIACLSEWQRESAKRLSNIILSHLYNDEGKHLLNPKKSVFISLITPELLSNEKMLKTQLQKDFKFI